MPTWLGLVIVVLLVASRPIELRLWRAGKLSDRAVTALVLARFPLVVAIGALVTGGPSVLSLALIGLATLMMAAFYPFTLGIVRDRARQDSHVTWRDAD